MTNYIDPTKWIILQYRPGSGGKMLLLCLMTIESIAHWDPEVEYNNITHTESLSKYWHSNKWLTTEPLVQWHSKFYSRMYPRGNDITLNQYNDLMNQYADDHFKKCWSSGKFILDFSHKTHIPTWHNGSMFLKLDAMYDDPIYKKMLLYKLFPWDNSTGIGTFLGNKPNINVSENTLKFKNQFEFGPFDDETIWYKFIWDKFLNFKIDNPDLTLTDLLNFEKVEEFIDSIANKLKSKYNANDLFNTHAYWISKHKF
jgi:hypothetical protein